MRNTNNDYESLCLLVLPMLISSRVLEHVNLKECPFLSVLTFSEL